MWIYKKSETRIWTVGHHDPRTDKWEPESDHNSPEAAATRVNYLNGENDSLTLTPTELAWIFTKIEEEVSQMESSLNGVDDHRITYWNNLSSKIKMMIAKMEDEKQ